MFVEVEWRHSVHTFETKSSGRKSACSSPGRNFNQRWEWGGERKPARTKVRRWEEEWDEEGGGGMGRERGVAE